MGQINLILRKLATFNSFLFSDIKSIINNPFCVLIDGTPEEIIYDISENLEIKKTSKMPFLDVYLLKR